MNEIYQRYTTLYQRFEEALDTARQQILDYARIQEGPESLADMMRGSGSQAVKCVGQSRDPYADRLLDAIVRRDAQQALCAKVGGLLGQMPEEHRQAIDWFIQKVRPSAYRTRMIEQALVLYVMLDPDSGLSVEEWLELKAMEAQLTGNAFLDQMRSQVLDVLSSWLLAVPEGEGTSMQSVQEALDKVPEAERDALYDYLERLSANSILPHDTATKRLVKRGITLFAYFYAPYQERRDQIHAAMLKDPYTFPKKFLTACHIPTLMERSPYAPLCS